MRSAFRAAAPPHPVPRRGTNLSPRERETTTLFLPSPAGKEAGGEGLNEFCQAEIENLRLTARGDENVRRLDVAVDDPLAMRCVQPIGSLNGDVE